MVNTRFKKPIPLGGPCTPANKDGCSAHYRSRIETRLFGSVNVARAALPVLQSQRSGLLVTISSTAGIAGQEFCTAYAASKFGSRDRGKHSRPRSLRSASARCSSSPASFAPSSSPQSPPATQRPPSPTTPSAPAQTRLGGRAWTGSRAVIRPSSLPPWSLVGQDKPPLRFPAGADAVATFEQNANSLHAQADAHRELASRLAYDDDYGIRLCRGSRFALASFRRDCLEDGEIGGSPEWLRWPSSRQRGRSGGERLGLELVELRLRDRPAVE
jgi:hypothetical protein